MGKITCKTPEEINILREAGSILAKILKELASQAAPGITTADLDTEARKLAKEHQVKPILFGYRASFAIRPFPAAICTSVNDCVQHGIPSKYEILEDGDIINIDMSISYHEMVVDSGLTVGVGAIESEAQRLLAVTQEALARGIKAAQPGKRIGDISAAIGDFVRNRGMSVVEVLCGHGVGYAIHEEPNIMNFGRPNSGPVIEVGHVYAIEPIVNLGEKDVYFDDDGDGYSVYTMDGSLSAHFEHTVAITERGPEILTKIRS